MKLEKQDSTVCIIQSFPCARERPFPVEPLKRPNFKSLGNRASTNSLKPDLQNRLSLSENNPILIFHVTFSLFYTESDKPYIAAFVLTEGV